MEPYIYHPQVVVRIPRLPYNSMTLEADVRLLVNDPIFLESIYLASPVLYRECIKYRDGKMKGEKDIQKLKNSVIKYYLRSSGRSTPFGLFSGCCVCEWQQAVTKLVIDKKHIRHTRFDMHYLCALAQQLAKKKGIKEHIMYFTNTSLYSVGDEMRYIEYRYFSGKRVHQITSVGLTVYLEKILKKGYNGITIDEMTTMLAAPEIEDHEIIGFVDEILEAQLLVNELEPAITGPEFIYQILDVLKKIAHKTHDEGVLKIIGILETANNKLGTMDMAAFNTEADYKEIALLLERLGVPYEESRLFQTDLSVEPVTGGIPMHLQGELFDALKILNRFGTYYSNNANLDSFIRRFSERYEDAEIPLLEALDVDTGIGYPEAGGKEHLPLVEDLVFINAPDPVQIYKWSPMEKFLGNKIIEALRHNKTKIEIYEGEMADLSNANWDDLPPSMSLVFRMVGEDNDLLYLENCGGSSAINLLGRFAHSNEKIHQLASSIVLTEEALNPDVVFAEIVHLPESRTGNILLHPAFRNHEIPYLSRSSLPKENQVPVKDLMVRVKNGKLILRSEKTGQVIVPRLSNAHNYRHNALPVYQFLCDMQTGQLRNGISFHWGSLLHHHRFLPRVQYKNIVLSPATWRFGQSDLSVLFEKDKDPMALLTTFRQHFNLPNIVLLIDGDNELLINLSDKIALKLFLDIARNKIGIELREFLGAGGSVTDTGNRPFNNQIIASLIKTVPTYNKPYKIKKTYIGHKKKSFMPGSEWLYFKIYCGAKSADNILTNAIKPSSELMLEKKIISNFFFIRYYDPSFHIRFRVRLTEGMAIGEVMQIVHDHLVPFHGSGHIWKVQTDTYFNETERYGTNTIDIAESIFHHDSMAVLDMLSVAWGDQREELRWLWAMRSVEELLNAFNYTIDQKIELTSIMKQAFAKEFKVDKHLKEQLNDKFRNKKASIEDMMDLNNKSIHLVPLFDVLDIKNNNIRPLANKLMELDKDNLLVVPLPELLFSYIHMFINRIITSRPRLHEMVIYDFLYRYYRSMLARINLAAQNLV